MGAAMPHSAIRRLSLGVLIAAVLVTNVTLGRAEDMLGKLPFIARSFGDVARPYSIAPLNGIPLSAALPQPQPKSDAFKLPASTANARAGTDPFTGRDIPIR